MMFTVLRFLIVSMFCAPAVFAQEKSSVDVNTWKQFVGKTGPSGWRVNVIQPDPKDHGPDGFNYHDWDGDGDIDIATTEENGGWGVIWFENPAVK